MKLKKKLQLLSPTQRIMIKSLEAKSFELFAINRNSAYLCRDGSCSSLEFVCVFPSGVMKAADSAFWEYHDGPESEPLTKAQEMVLNELSVLGGFKQHSHCHEGVVHAIKRDGRKYELVAIGTDGNLWTFCEGESAP